MCICTGQGKRSVPWEVCRLRLLRVLQTRGVSVSRQHAHATHAASLSHLTPSL